MTREPDPHTINTTAMLLCMAIISIGLLAVQPSAHGEEIREMGPYVIAPAEAGYTRQFEVEQFDVDTTPWPVYAYLTGIEFTLTATLSGSLGIENEDAFGVSEFTVTLSNVLNLRRGGTLITTATPEYTYNSTLDTYDGVTDYMGASGETFAVSGSDSATASTEELSDLEAFTGNGTILLQLEALNESILWNATGGKTYSPLQNPLVGAELLVQYTYAPEPSAGVLASVFVLFGVLKRRHRRTV